MKKFIAYYRVSTDRQGRSGIGLEAQTASVRDYVTSRGELVAEYTEVETVPATNTLNTRVMPEKIPGFQGLAPDHTGCST